MCHAPLPGSQGFISHSRLPIRGDGDQELLYEISEQPCTNFTGQEPVFSLCLIIDLKINTKIKKIKSMVKSISLRIARKIRDKITPPILYSLDLENVVLFSVFINLKVYHFKLETGILRKMKI